MMCSQSVLNVVVGAMKEFTVNWGIRCANSLGTGCRQAYSEKDEEFKLQLRVRAARFTLHCP